MVLDNAHSHYKEEHGMYVTANLVYEYVPSSFIQKKTTETYNAEK